MRKRWLVFLLLLTLVMVPQSVGAAKEDEDELYDWEKLSKSMSEQDAQLGLDFAKTRCEYAVVASVASAGVDEECGSNEDFYFQLIFEKGSSGVVYANTQLPSDGFRTGTDEVFFIKTNRDYGNLESVRIIPMPVREGAFDKLKLDSITVSETDGTGISHKWMVQDIGWIGNTVSDYTAESHYEDKTITDISNVYGVTGEGTTVNLLVCLATSDFSLEDELAVQYEGMVKGQIDYLSTSGYYRTRVFDVVEAIKAYNTSEMGYETISRADAYETESLMLSDPGRMFRANHMDRFVITLEDMVSVSDIRFFCNSNVQTTWGIESVSLSLIKESGILAQNSNDEAVRESVTVPFALNKAAVSNPAYQVACSESGVSSVTIPFTENRIQVDEETGDTEVVADTTAGSGEDSLNLFVFPDETGKNARIGSYDIQSALQYVDVYGTTHQVSAVDHGMQKIATASGSSLFYYIGLSGEKLSSLSQLLLTCSEESENPAMIDHAIVQRIRGNSVIGTYYFDVAADVRGIIKNIPPTSSYGKKLQISNQQLTVQFSDDTEQISLQEGERDVSFAITYISTLNPEYEEVRSAFVSLAESGIQKLRPGMVVSVPFMEPYAGDIISISGVCSGDFHAGVRAAYLTELESDASSFSSGYYSFSEGLNLSTAVSDAAVTATSRYESGAVLPLRLTFGTSKAAVDVESGADGRVSAKLGYLDTEGMEQTVKLSDIRNYMIDEEESLSAGGECKIQLLLSDVANLSYIQLKTEDSGWSLAWVAADLGDGMIKRSRVVDARVGTSWYTVPLDYSNIARDSGEATKADEDDKKTAKSDEESEEDTKTDEAGKEDTKTEKAGKEDTQSDEESGEDTKTDEDGEEDS